MPFTQADFWRIALVLGKILITGSIFYFLYQSVFEVGTQPELWLSQLLEVFHKGERTLVGLAFCLIIFNWGLEALKWQKLSGKVEILTFIQAFRAVLVGMCLGFITPNRFGDYAGRILEMKSRHRLEALGAVFLGRFCQLFITVVGGSIGVFYFVVNFYLASNPHVAFGLLISLLLINLLFSLVLFHPGVILNFIQVIPVLKNYHKYLAVLSKYSGKELHSVVAISAVRYFVFVGQFMLLLKAFGINVPWWQLAFGVGGTFLLKSVVPSFTALTDLGMRELSAMYFFSLLAQDKIMVMSASLNLWFLNIALPSLVGLLFVLQLKLKNIRKPEKV